MHNITLERIKNALHLMAPFGTVFLSPSRKNESKKKEELRNTEWEKIKHFETVAKIRSHKNEYDGITKINKLSRRK